ncbi:MAG TPA: UrcA family protein [Sphingomonas sp.]|jgi:UrcA family protein
MFKAVLAIAALAVPALTSPALAQSGSWRVGEGQFHIYYADLDVNSAAGRAALLKRVERAAAKLCDGLSNGRERRTCVADTMRLASTGLKGARLARAMTERDGTALAAR